MEAIEDHNGRGSMPLIGEDQKANFTLWRRRPHTFGD